MSEINGILLATDEGTHGGPDTVRVYQRVDDRGMYAVRYHAGNSYATETVAGGPLEVSTPGYMRWIGPEDVGAAVREARAANAAAKRAEEAHYAQLAAQGKAVAAVQSLLAAAGADLSGGLLVSPNLTDSALMDDASAAAVKAMPFLCRGEGEDYDARTRADGKCYRVRISGFEWRRMVVAIAPRPAAT